MDNLVKVAINIAHNNGIFTYRLPQNEPNVIGRRVKVTLKNRPVTGVIVDTCHPDQEQHFKIKDIIKIIDQAPIITKEQRELMLFCAKYYFNALGPCIHLGVLRDEKAPRELSLKTTTIEEYDLSTEQNNATKAILANESGAFLLQGVTGSGKTHVYLSVAKATLLEQKSVLFLVPEISLTPQLVKRVQSALGIKPLVIHSNITQAKKRDTFFALLNQPTSVLIGARSAIFAPLHNLGLIVVDEEHDASLKQDESPRYHARDLALWRAKNEHAHVILGSATPSLESIFNAQQRKLTHLVLEQRFKSEKQTMPKVSIIDLKERAEDVDFRTQDRNKSAGSKMCILSRPLIEEMKNALNNDTQVLLFLNQRGYAKWGVCHQCGTMVECPYCSVGLTYYQNRRLLLCHQCKHAEEALTTCRNCNHDAVQFLGLGTERLEEEVRLIFPDTIILRLDRDVVRSQRRLESTLTAMHERKAHILIGTQMIAKGHDFLHVGLVGIVCADVALSMPDFRAGEKAFQLFTQVAGRAGRGNSFGKVMIQTFNPEHQSIVFAKDHNVKDFVAQELAMRQRFSKPPFSRAAVIRCEHKDEDTAESLIKLAYNILSSNKRLTILGPAPSPIERINNRFRFQLMALAKNTSYLHEALSHVALDKKIALNVAQTKARFIIDVDPQNLS